MGAVQKFFPTWRVNKGWGIAIAGGAIVAALAIPFLAPGGTLRGVLVAALGLVLAAGLFALLIRLVPVKATTDGVMATRGFSARSHSCAGEKSRQLCQLLQTGCDNCASFMTIPSQRI